MNETKKILDDPSGKKSKKSQRIKGSDFRSWDKYDAEEECKKVDDPEFVSTKKKVYLPIICINNWYSMRNHYNFYFLGFHSICV